MSTDTHRYKLVFVNEPDRLPFWSSCEHIEKGMRIAFYEKDNGDVLHEYRVQDVFPVMSYVLGSQQADLSWCQVELV